MITLVIDFLTLQTAKHYGNLGRLYQSMEYCDKAEQMHLKAIHIKEKLLGKDDYEVALSIGHLASLYNYDMKEYGKAEELHVRSIKLGLKLFGPGYSGLEYDYRGLLRIYQELQASLYLQSLKNTKVFDTFNRWTKCVEFWPRQESKFL